MSGECEKCNEHTMDCRCKMMEIKVWGQMFFEDGSISEGIRVNADILDDEMGAIQQLAVKILGSLNRTQGLLLIWGAGTIFTRYYNLEEVISS